MKDKHKKDKKDQDDFGDGKFSHSIEEWENYQKQQMKKQLEGKL